MAKIIVSLCFCFAVFSLKGQSFELEQFSQLYRPRIRIDAYYQGSGLWQNKKTDIRFNHQAQQYTAHVSVPIAGKLSLGAEVDLTQPNIKDILKNSVRVKAWQLMLNGRLGYRYSQFDSVRNLRSFNSSAYLGSIGISGVKLTKRFRMLFYSINVNLAEEAKSLKYYDFRANATLGWAKINGLRQYFIYGFHLNVSDRLALPIPFIGGRVRLNNAWNFNYVLPLQLNVQYKPDMKWSMFLGMKPDGQRWGYYINNTRGRLTNFLLTPYVASRYSINNNLQLRFEAGYGVLSRYNGFEFNNTNETFRSNNTWYLQFTFNQLLGKSLLEQAIDRLL
jgi:hypothetical protein